MKYNYLETFRGLMALWVMIMHGMGFLYVLPSNFLTKIFYNGFLPVVGFIILSGFVTHVLLDKRETYLFYIKRRALRLFPIYLICFIMSLALIPIYTYVLKNLTFNNPSSKVRLEHIDLALNNHFELNILSHLGLLHGLFPNDSFPFTYTIMGQSWSLTLEWQFYLFIPFLYGLLYLKKNKKINFLIVTVLAVLVPLSYIYMPQNSFLPYMIEYFLIGFFAYPLFRNNQILLVLFLSIISGFFIFKDWMISLMTLVFLILLLLQKKRYKSFNILFENKYLLKVGKISYSIYCIHMIVFYLVIFSLLKLKIEQNITFAFLTIIFGSTFTILLSNYTYKYIELKFMKIKLSK